MGVGYFLLTRLPRNLGQWILGSCVLLAGCAPESQRSPALPLALFETPGEPPTWADPGDATCSFPPGAADAKIDAASVTLRILVGPDGLPKAVQMLDEPGFGFDYAAARCAMARKYQPGTDDQGVPITSWTPPIRIRFIR
ncbi:MAG TPA: energy transducer TonB [Polyangiaceae bacterium]|nr:energy transducer TonB [Polyangiaceae bacterium]